MFFAMSEVVFKMIPFCFQGIVVFVLYFPPGSSCLYNLFNIVGIDRKGGGKGVAIAGFPVFGERSQFALIDHQCVVGLTQGYVGGVTVGVYFNAPPRPASNCQGMNVLTAFKHFNPLVSC